VRRTSKRLLVLCVVLILLLTGAIAVSRTPYGVAILKSKDHFIQSELDPRVLYEAGAERHARMTAESLETAMRAVEAKHGLPFEGPFRVYVCDSHESVSEYMAGPRGQRVRGVKVLNDVFLAPSAFASGFGDTHSEVLAHELSHLHLYQRLGHLRALREVPQWFHDGLATVVSGAGGEGVDDAEAFDAILHGPTLVPDERGGFWRPKRPRDYGLPHGMFYKQSAMFVAYITERNPDAFEDFMLGLQLTEWSSFASLFEASFGTDVAGMWEGFVRHAELASGPSSA
jgi:hypothetical protein